MLRGLGMDDVQQSKECCSRSPARSKGARQLRQEERILEEEADLELEVLLEACEVARPSAIARGESSRRSRTGEARIADVCAASSRESVRRSAVRGEEGPIPRRSSSARAVSTRLEDSPIDEAEPGRKSSSQSGSARAGSIRRAKEGARRTGTAGRRSAGS